MKYIVIIGSIIFICLMLSFIITSLIFDYERKRDDANENKSKKNI